MDRRNFESYAEAVRWIVWGGLRRAGTLGRVVSLVGEDASGSPIEIERDGEVWRVRPSSGTPIELSSADLVTRAGDGTLTITHARIRHDLPALLFQAAVNAAQESLHDAKRAESGSGLSGGTDPESEAAFEFVLATSAQDSAVRHGIGAVVLAVATAEAQINGWAGARGGWVVLGKDDEDKLSLMRKCKALAAKAGVALDTGRAPYQELDRIVDRRNVFVHGGPDDYLVPLVGPGTIPGRSLSVEGRTSCAAVRRALVDLAQAIGEEVPEYLAYCPPGDPRDDEAWNSAVLMTGTRDDPDFAKTVECLEAETGLRTDESAGDFAGTE